MRLFYFSWFFFITEVASLPADNTGPLNKRCCLHILPWWQIPGHLFQWGEQALLLADCGRSLWAGQCADALRAHLPDASAAGQRTCQLAQDGVASVDRQSHRQPHAGRRLRAPIHPQLIRFIPLRRKCILPLPFVTIMAVPASQPEGQGRPSALSRACHSCAADVCRIIVRGKNVKSLDEKKNMYASSFKEFIAVYSHKLSLPSLQFENYMVRFVEWIAESGARRNSYIVAC